MIVVLLTIFFSNHFNWDFSHIGLKTDMVHMIMSTVPPGVKWPIYVSFSGLVFAASVLLLELRLQGKDSS